MAQLQLKALPDRPVQGTAPSPVTAGKAALQTADFVRQLSRTKALYSFAGTIASAVFFGCLYLLRVGELQDEGFLVLLISSWLSLLLFINASKLSGQVKILTLLQAIEEETKRAESSSSSSSQRAA